MKHWLAIIPRILLGAGPGGSGGASARAGGRFALWGGQQPSGLQETGFVFTE